MRKWRWVLAAIGVGVVSWVVLAGVSWWVAFGNAIDRRFDRLPPEEAFEFAFQRPVPAGVTDLRATGQAWIAGSYVWLRFRAPRSVIRSLTSTQHRDEFKPSEIRDQEDVYASTRSHYDPTDGVGWKDLTKLRTGSVFSGEFQGGSITVWVDEAQGIAYVFRVGS